jgi:hypothetical protein
MRQNLAGETLDRVIERDLLDVLDEVYDVAFGAAPATIANLFFGVDATDRCRRSADTGRNIRSRRPS